MPLTLSLPRALRAAAPWALLLSGFLVGAPLASAQHQRVPDTLAVSTEAPQAASNPTRRCRDSIDRLVGTPPVAQARCSGGFGLPAVKAGHHTALVDERLHARMRAAIGARLAEQDRVGK